MQLKRFSFTFLTFCLAVASGTKAAQAVSLTTLASGFNNARGITYGPDNNLYLGETGTGGNGACQPSPSTAYQPICAGNSGAIAKISLNGQVQNVVSNFQSLALQPTKYEGAGPQVLKFDSQGQAYFISGYAGFPGNRDSELNALAPNTPVPPEQAQVAPALPADKLLNTSDLGKFYKLDLSTGKYTALADLAKYELVNNPDKGDVISNPYDLAISGDTAYIADGGGNAVYSVKLDGSDLKAIPLPRRTQENPVFPPPAPGTGAPATGQADGQALPPAGQSGQPTTPSDSQPGSFVPPGQSGPVQTQSVPTGITVGPDGAVYVAEYSGFPFTEGSARIWRIGADGTPQVYADGFTQLTDLKFDKNGNLLALQFGDQSQWKYSDEANIPGSLIQIAPDGTRTTLVAAGQGLESATGIAFGPDNEIYVTNHGVGPGTGQVVRIDGIAGRGSATVRPVPEPTSALGVLAFGAIGATSMLKRKRKLLAHVENNS